MKNILLCSLLTFLPMAMSGQTANDSIFKGRIYNEEYKVFFVINLYENNVVSPYQEIFGELPGYFGSDTDGRQWLITSAKIKNKHTATLAITNDYGSEDLTATLTYKDGIYTLKQEEGSRIKIAVNRKWVKIPQTLDFKRTGNKKGEKHGLLRAQDSRP